MKTAFFMLYFVSFASIAQPTEGQDHIIRRLDVIQLGNMFAGIAEDVRSSVVSVISDRRPQTRPFSLPQWNRSSQTQRGLGSGFVLSTEGDIVTNYHVVQGMNRILVIFADKQVREAIILGADAKTDIAVLKITGTLPATARPAMLGDSDRVRAGHFVLAFGAPFGLMQTVTQGIIGAVGRSDLGIVAYEDFLQTDAAINPGNSGGPLVDVYGHVIGIATAIASPVGQSAGVGFAIPINMAKDILPALLAGREVIRGLLGVSVVDVPELSGALIREVAPRSPADVAGLRPGDVIIAIDGESSVSARQLRHRVARTQPGSILRLEIVRPDGVHETTRAQVERAI